MQSYFGMTAEEKWFQSIHRFPEIHSREPVVEINFVHCHYSVIKKSEILMEKQLGNHGYIHIDGQIPQPLP